MINLCGSLSLTTAEKTSFSNIFAGAGGLTTAKKFSLHLSLQNNPIVGSLVTSLRAERK